jgi:cytochrome c-type biogenesis protein CcmF
VLIMAVAVSVSATLSSESTTTLRTGQSAELRGYRLTYQRLSIAPLADDPRVIETRAELRYDGPQQGVLATASRQYPNSTTAIATPAVRSSIGEDLYVTLLSADPATGAITVHLFVNPLVSWIWLGGAVVALGAVFAILPDRRRIGVPAPSVSRQPRTPDGAIIPDNPVPLVQPARPTMEEADA